jgi:hypothetical protein
MWRKTTRDRAAARLIAAPRDIRDMPSAKERGSVSKSVSALKTIALMRKVRHHGVCKVDWIFTFACAAYNLVRMRNLAAVVPAV